jgi:hypothetical protein
MNDVFASEMSPNISNPEIKEHGYRLGPGCLVNSPQPQRRFPRSPTFTNHQEAAHYSGSDLFIWQLSNKELLCESNVTMSFTTPMSPRTRAVWSASQSQRRLHFLVLSGIGEKICHACLNLSGSCGYSCNQLSPRVAMTGEESSRLNSSQKLI